MMVRLNLLMYFLLKLFNGTIKKSNKPFEIECAYIANQPFSTKTNMF